MRVLVLGSGAREHTITWKFSQSNRISGLYAAPGNAGTAELCDNIENLDPTDVSGIIDAVKKNKIDLVFVGPEMPLAKGVVDALSSAGIATLGPHKEAAQLESSKSFSKAFMARHGIPTATAEEFDDYSAFERHVEKQKGNLVVKKSGLAAGKGVLESSDVKETIAFGREILENDTVLVEEFLNGWEVSIFALSDGRDYMLLPACADFKKAGDHDSGANTGGMGAICPVPPLTHDLQKIIEETIIKPTFEGMKKEGLMYTGVLYFGLMITPTGPKALEYNVRFGDPETQVLLPLIRSDFVNLCEAMLEGSIAQFPLQVLPDYALGVVVAAPGYPSSYKKKILVTDLPETVNRKLYVFHASTKKNDDGHTVTDGGRCFTVVGLGPTILSANKRAYESLPSVQFDGAWYRSDIGQKFLIEE